MGGKSYWNNYYKSIQLGFQLTSTDAYEVEVNISMPKDFSLWCKGNTNNGKILFISMVRELLFEKELSFLISTNLEQYFLPIDSRGCGDFKIGAKALLEEAKAHIIHLDYLSHLELSFGIFITDVFPQQKLNIPITFLISSDLSSVSIFCKKNLEEFSLSIMEGVVESIDNGSIVSNSKIATTGKEIIDFEVNKSFERKNIIEKAWNAIFDYKLNWDKNYYGNGGDSIQAIRLLAKLKEQGALVDLASLINAYSLAYWSFELGDTKLKKENEKDEPSSFQLTEMQQKIWSHYQSFKDFGAYHEQFLFELKRSPSKEIMERCINAIWKSYPNLRIHVLDIDNVSYQEVQESTLAISEMGFDSVDQALLSDIQQPFEESLLRLSLLTVKEKKYLLWSHHHLILDGWSVGILIREFIERINQTNYAVVLKPNYQYKLNLFEKKFPPIYHSDAITPFNFPIHNFQKSEKFKTLNFDLSRFDMSKEGELLEKFQITKQLLFCGIAGVLLRSLSNKPEFYFNGISSGRDFLEVEIDEAVGLFIRNTQIGINIDVKSTWSSFFLELNENFQQTLSTVNRPEISQDVASNSDFLFIYENYPYTNIESDLIEAELMHVNEITGYPVTFCLFPTKNDYTLRIVYDARRFEENFINGLKIKFEEIYMSVMNADIHSSVISKNLLNIQHSDVVAIDFLSLSDFNANLNTGQSISFIDGSGWSDLFDKSTFTTEFDQNQGIEFWRRQLFNDIPGYWKDQFVKENPTKVEQKINCDYDEFLVLVKFVKYLKLSIWGDTDFQINIKKNECVFPLIIDRDSNEKQLISSIEKQIECSELYLNEFQEIIADKWSNSSNFLFVFDDSSIENDLNNFDFIINLNRKNSTLIIFSSEAISSSFVFNFSQFIEAESSFDTTKELSYLSNLNEPENTNYSPYLTLFADQVARCPNQMAVDDGSIKFSYQELDQRANQLARFLINSYSIEDSTFIGLKLKRGANQLVAIIAIFKIGKAFIPIDVNWPEKRIDQIVNQAKLNLIIDDAILTEINIENFSAEPIIKLNKSINLPFYSLFTSGSTGTPKGCVISEYAFLNYLDHTKNHYFKNQEGTNIHVFTPFTFDFTLTSLLGGIAFGLSLIIHSEEENTYESLQLALNDKNSFLIKLTPSHINLSEKIWFTESTIKKIIVGGEALTDMNISKCLGGTSHQLINEYGPTEATVGCVFQEIKLDQTPLIGRPINGMGVVVLDKNDKVVSRGLEGELCLFGSGLSDGYLNDQNKTALSFNVWSGDALTKIYRTGDMVQMQQDGCLLFVNRKDSQVKLNGYRIETEEINAVIREITTLECISVIVEHEASKQLITFIEGDFSNFNLIQLLGDRLPSYMLPAQLIQIEKFPLTSNGKLDVKQLESNLKSLNNTIYPKINEFDIAQILIKWAQLDNLSKQVLNTTSLRSKGWDVIQEQINFLHQMNASDISLFIPELIIKDVPSFISKLRYSKNKKLPSNLIFTNCAISFNQLIDYARELKEYKFKLTTDVNALFAKTINSLSALDNFSLPTEIFSDNIPFLKVNVTALVLDWSQEVGFHFFIRRNSNGELICLLPKHLKDIIIDDLGFIQPEGWNGNLPFLKSKRFTFCYSNGDLFIQKNEVIKRFSHVLKLYYIENLLYNTFEKIDCVCATTLRNKIFVFIQATKQINIAEVNTLLKFNLPAWCQIDHVIFTSTIENDVNNLENFSIENDNSNFISFLTTYLPEYSYLNGFQSLIEQGGDSITALRIVGKLKNKGFKIEVGALLSSETIAEYLLSLSQDSHIIISSHIIQLTPIQQWFLNDYNGNKNHFNQSILLQILLSIDPASLVHALQSTLDSHSILSKVYVDSWIASKNPTIQHIKCKTEEEVTNACSKIQESFDLQIGPVAGGAIIEVENKILLFVAIHHLYCDGYTWRIILDDLQAILSDGVIERDSHVVFGKVRNQFIEMCAESSINSSVFYEEEINNPFIDYNTFTYSQSNYTEWEWSIEETKWFQYSTEIGTTSNEKFLFLFLKIWIDLGHEPTTIFFETHGRFYEGIPELSETIGWFTQFYPVFTSSWPKLATLKEEISAQFSLLPKNGLTYMGENSWKKPPFPVLLNYLGNFDENRGEMAIPSQISQGNMTSLDNPTFAAVELNALIVEGKMKWMLRTHPKFDVTSFKLKLNSFAEDLIGSKTVKEYIDQSIDQDDIDAINALLGEL